MVDGNISGIKRVILEELEELSEMEFSAKEFIQVDFLRRISEISGELGREISIYLTRSGQVVNLSVGSGAEVTMPHMRKRRGYDSISGIRCIHTHPGGTSHLSDVDKGTLLSARMDAMAAVALRGTTPVSLCVGYIGEKLSETVEYGPFAIERLPQGALMEEIKNATKRVTLQIDKERQQDFVERAILLGLNATPQSMEELKRLSDTAGVEVVYQTNQKRPRDHAFYVGKGKARELSLKVAALNSDVVIVNDELSAIELRNLEEIVGVKVIDRTTLILDIFAGHAKTKEGRLQVELAQLKYNLPRLVGQGAMLSRLGGGIGTKGPGEKKLELDRRTIRRRIFELEQEIQKLKQQRDMRRKNRKESGMKEIAIVGYTNAGKSTLLKRLSGSEIYVEDKLFATLDPVTRKVAFASGAQALFTDTVGFIDKLPHELIDAFRSTLEVATYAHLLLHIVDVSNPDYENQIHVVEEVLASIGAGDKPVIRVYNKVDLVELPDYVARDGVCISAKTGEGLGQLFEAIERYVKDTTKKISLTLGYHRGDVLAKINQYGKNIQIDYGEQMEISVDFPKSRLNELMEMLDEPAKASLQ